MTSKIKISADNVADASRNYIEKREASGLGAAKFPLGSWNEFYISYNGKVWRDDPSAINWVSAKPPVYEPRTTA